MASGVNSSLDIITYAEPLVGLHKLGIGIGQGQLPFTAFLKPVAITLVTLLAFLANIKLVLNNADIGAKIASDI